MLLLLGLGVIVWVAVGSLTAEERGRLFAHGSSACRLFLEQVRRSRAKDEWFREALRRRTRFTLVVPAIIVAEVVLYVLAHVSGAGHDPRAAALAWGASFGPRTTNGEWWRLITSLLLQPSFFGVVVGIAALATVGSLLERYLGPVAFLATFFSSGVLAGAANLWRHPVEVRSGPAPSIFGLYGLLLGSIVWIVQRRRAADSVNASETEGANSTAHTDTTDLLIPGGVLRRLVPAAALFVVYAVRNDGLTAIAELAAVGSGLAAGLIVSRGATVEKPGARIIGAVTLGAFAAAAVLAFPMRGVADIWPEVDRIVALEHQTGTEYLAARDRLKRGRTNAGTVADAIDRTILPPLHAADARVRALTGVPAEQQPVLEDAKRYFDLRINSWTLRAAGLRKAGAVPEPERDETTPSASARWRLKAEAMYRTNTATLARAETAERSALETLRRLDSSRPQW